VRRSLRMQKFLDNGEHVQQGSEWEQRGVKSKERHQSRMHDVKSWELQEWMQSYAARKWKSMHKAGSTKIANFHTNTLENTGVDQNDEGKKRQLQRERQEKRLQRKWRRMTSALRKEKEKMQQRAMESKRLDHLCRALREEEQESLEVWAGICIQDQESIDRLTVENQRKTHEDGLKEKAQLLVYKAAVRKWMAPQIKQWNEHLRQGNQKSFETQELVPEEEVMDGW